MRPIQKECKTDIFKGEGASGSLSIIAFVFSTRPSLCYRHS